MERSVGVRPGYGYKNAIGQFTLYSITGLYGFATKTYVLSNLLVLSVALELDYRSGPLRTTSGRRAVGTSGQALGHHVPEITGYYPAPLRCVVHAEGPAGLP